jgi:hypothetical protein
MKVVYLVKECRDLVRMIRSKGLRVNEDNLVSGPLYQRLTPKFESLVAALTFRRTAPHGSPRSTFSMASTFISWVRSPQRIFAAILFDFFEANRTCVRMNLMTENFWESTSACDVAARSPARSGNRVLV